MDIQRLHLSDAISNQLPALARSAFDATYRPHNPDELIDAYLQESLSDEAIGKELADLANVFFVAVDDDTITGYLKLRPSNGPDTMPIDNSAEIERIYVAPDQTSRGIGASLIKAACAYATKAGYQTLWLGVWTENDRAIKFYQREGFQIIGEHVFMMKDDQQRDYVMSINLSEPDLLIVQEIAQMPL